MEIAGKIAWVTGAASGIGQATAVTLAEAGAAGVAVSDVRGDALADTVGRVEKAGAQALPLEADASSVDDTRRCLEAIEARFGRLDVLHANAGMGEAEAGWPDVAPERAAAIVAVNLGGVVIGTRLALDLLQRDGGGVVVATSSGAGQMPVPHQAVYAATKAGVIHFAASCVPLAESHGVRVNCVCPGLTDTPMMYEAGGGEIADWLQPVIDASGLLQPSDIAKVVLDVIRDDSLVGQAVPAMEPA